MRSRNTLLCLSLAALCGCAHVGLVETKPDGTKTSFAATTLLSNTTLKGLTVNGVTKTTSQSLRVTGSTSEPNPEAITASASGLGSLLGEALRAYSGIPPIPQVPVAK